jgi:hypothetical protein
VSILLVAGLLAGGFLGRYFSALILVCVYALAVPLIVGCAWYTHMEFLRAVAAIGILILSTQTGYILASLWFIGFWPRLSKGPVRTREYSYGHRAAFRKIRD